LEFISGKSEKPKLTTMKTKSLLFLSLFISLFFLRSVAQETTSTTGGNLTGASGTISYTVGQVTNLYLSETNGSVAQGVQQPYEIFLITGINEAQGVTLDFQVYPNPVQDFLKLKIRDLNTENLVWKMHDSNGKLLNTDRVSGTETSIPITNYPSGVYLFSVLSKNNLQYKTFQIIKN
jgi:hypothetical protein